MTKVFFGDWEESGQIGMVADFANVYMTAAEYAAPEVPWKNSEYYRESKQKLKAALESGLYPAQVLFAAYVNENYEGDAFVLYEQNGKLFEVNGGHCSCYGLEGQWDPEETSSEAILKRLTSTEYGIWGRYSDDIKAALALTRPQSA